MVSAAAADWTLDGCCNKDQIAFIATFLIFIFIIFALWRTPVLTPFKLITVFLHELSHATACKLTCGQVEGIEVNVNEGGVTHTRGGWQWIILPAGYIGSSFWGMVLVIMATTRISAYIAAAALCIALLVVLWKAKNNFLRFLCIGFLVFIIIIWVINITTIFKPLRYVILFMGVMNGLFSVYDIYDDLISRRVNTSDAEKFAEICPCPCNGPAWGILWGLISFTFLCGSLYLSLVLLQ